MIIFVPKAGLGNRMRGIASAYRIAKSIDEQLHIVWIDNHECNCPMKDLFDLPEEVQITHIPWIPVPLSIRMHIQDMIRTHYKKKCNRVLLNEDLWDMKPEFIQGLTKQKVYIETAAGWDCEAEDAFDIFQVNKEITSKAESYINSNQLKEVPLIGVHIRRTDMENADADSPRAAFEKVMREELDMEPRTCFYLASDDVNEKEYFINRFGTKHVFTQNLNMKRETQNGIKAALQEIVILGFCKKIYGTKGSSFSNLAADMGKVPFAAVTKEML